MSFYAVSSIVTFGFLEVLISGPWVPVAFRAAVCDKGQR